MNTFIRADNIRQANQLRTIEIIRHYTKHAEGAVLVKFGDTHVLCTASVEEKVPGFLKGKNQGWVTAEYGMLPRSTGSRMDREAARGKQSGRTQEIQRLIGRSLRAIIDLKNWASVACILIVMLFKPMAVRAPPVLLVRMWHCKMLFQHY